jgi:hypothetical protein
VNVVPNPKPPIREEAESEGFMKNNQTKSNRGGVRAGAGRKAGSPNKVTATLRDQAREYTPDALLTLAEIMRDESSPAAARVAASNGILDRGYGKPSMVLSGDEEGGPIAFVGKVVLEGVRPSADG